MRNRGGFRWGFRMKSSSSQDTRKLRWRTSPRRNRSFSCFPQGCLPSIISSLRLYSGRLSTSRAAFRVLRRRAVFRTFLHTHAYTHTRILRTRNVIRYFDHVVTFKLDGRGRHVIPVVPSFFPSLPLFMFWSHGNTIQRETIVRNLLYRNFYVPLGSGIIMKNIYSSSLLKFFFVPPLSITIISNFILGYILPLDIHKIIHERNIRDRLETKFILNLRWKGKRLGN